MTVQRHIEVPTEGEVSRIPVALSDRAYDILIQDSLLDGVGDRVPVRRAKRERFEYQQVERSLEQLSLHRHIPSFRHPLHKIIDLSVRVHRKFTLIVQILPIPRCSS